MTRSRVTGGRQISQALRELSAALDVPMKAAARHALRPVVAEAKANLARNGSVESGELMRLMTVKEDRERSRKLKPVLTVGPSKEGGHYRVAHLVEFGTRAHPQPKQGRPHPGAAAKPFLRPAFEAQKDEAVRRFGERVGPEIEKRAKRRAAKAAKR